jgi:intracellular multiplication protein IcmD
MVFIKKVRDIMNKYKVYVIFLAVLGLLFTVGAHAQATDGLGAIAETVTQSFESFGKLMIAIAYLGGFGFMIFGVFKFKQHKDNPTQIPLGTPITMVMLGAVLVFLPAFVQPAGETLGVDMDKAGGFTGNAASQLPGNS